MTAAEHISKNLVQDALKYREGLASVPKIANQGQDSFTDKTIVNGQRSEVLVKETMRGYVGGMPCTAYLRMKMNPQDQKGPNERKLGTQEAHSLLRGKVGGHVKLRAFEKDDLHVLDGDVNFCEVDCRTPYTQYMHYHLLLGASTGSRYIKLESSINFLTFIFLTTILMQIYSRGKKDNESFYLCIICLEGDDNTACDICESC